MDLPAQNHREAIAKIIFDLAFVRLDGFPKPAWVPGGNSTKQDDARRIADAILALPVRS